MCVPAAKNLTVSYNEDYTVPRQVDGKIKRRPKIKFLCWKVREDDEDWWWDYMWLSSRKSGGVMDFVDNLAGKVGADIDFFLSGWFWRKMARDGVERFDNFCVT